MFLALTLRWHSELACGDLQWFNLYPVELLVVFLDLNCSIHEQVRQASWLFAAFPTIAVPWNPPSSMLFNGDPRMLVFMTFFVFILIYIYNIYYQKINKTFINRGFEVVINIKISSVCLWWYLIGLYWSGVMLYTNAIITTVLLVSFTGIIFYKLLDKIKTP